VTPHDFLKYVPRTNCGECGYAACLAFAVAVTKGGENAEKCPHLDPAFTTSSGDPSTAAPTVGAGRSEMQEDRDMALVAHLKGKIRDIDFRELAPRLGADWSPQEPDDLLFSYLGRPVRVGKERLLMAGEELVDPRDQILLYNYVSFGGGRPPDGNWIGLESLPNSISKVRTLATYCEDRIAKRFAGRTRILAALLQQLNSLPGPDDQSCSVGMIIPVLPHLPHYLLFWDEEPEDGFEAKVKVLFDHHVMDFLDLESLVFAAERTADRLAELDRGNRLAQGKQCRLSA